MYIEVTYFYDCTRFSLLQKSCILKAAFGKEEIMGTINYTTEADTNI